MLSLRKGDLETLSDTDIKTPESSPPSDAGGARARQRRLLFWSLVLPFDSYYLSVAFFIFFNFSLPDLTSSMSVVTRRSQLTGIALFSGGSRRACACASLIFQLSLLTRMLFALGFKSLILNRCRPSHPLNKWYAVLNVNSSSASLVSVNLDALSNPPPDYSLQPYQLAANALLFLCRVLTLKRLISDSRVTHVHAHRCLVAIYPFVSANDSSSADNKLPTIDMLTCDKYVTPSFSIKQINSSSAQSSSAVWYLSSASLRSGGSMADVSPSSFTVWARPMKNIQEASLVSSPTFMDKVCSIITFMNWALLAILIRTSDGFFKAFNRIFQRLMLYLSFLKSLSVGSPSPIPSSLPSFLLSMKGTKVSVSLPSILFSLNTILLSCVAVSTGPENVNQITFGFFVGAGWSSTSQPTVIISQLANLVVQAPLTHSCPASNSLSSSYEDLST